MAANASDILLDVATPDVIMMEILIYCVGSLVILFLMDFYAVRKIGSKRRLGYQALKGIRGISTLIICGFTVVIGFLCLTQDFSCTRGTLSYFGLPYLIALLFYLIKMFRRVRAETKGRGF